MNLKTIQQSIDELRTSLNFKQVKYGITSDFVGPASCCNVLGVDKNTGNLYYANGAGIWQSILVGGGTYWGANGANIYNLNAGSVGIGTVSPLSSLHVENNTFLKGNIDVGVRYNDASVQFSLQSDRNWLFNMYRTSGVIATSLMQNGNFGIGISTPTERLHVVGNGLFTGNVGIGTVPNSYQLNIQSPSATGLRVQTTGGSINNPSLDFYDAATGVEAILTPNGSTAVFGTYSAHDVVLSPNRVTALIAKVGGSIVVPKLATGLTPPVTTGVLKMTVSDNIGLQSTLPINNLFGYTFATLPVGTIGDTAYITNGPTSPVYLAVATGGGTTVVPVFRNATTWIFH